MDSTQLPQPQMPTNDQQNSPAPEPVAASSSPSSPSPSPSPQSTQPTIPTTPAAPATAPSVPTSAAQSPQSVPTPTPPADPQLMPQKSALQPAPEPVPQFTSPILKNAQQVQAEPFQQPDSQFNTEDQSSAMPSTTSTNLDNLLSGSVPTESAATGAIDPSQLNQSSQSNQDQTNQTSSGATSQVVQSGNSLFKNLRSKLPSTPMLLIGGGIGLLILLVVGGLYWYLSRGSESTLPAQAPVVNKTVTLTYQGLWEDEDVFEALIQKYEQQNPGIQIKYQQQNSNQYRERLQTDIKQGQGPDIFRFHNTWVPMLQDQLDGAPANIFPASVLKDEFYPVMSDDLVIGNQVVGIPLMYDGLALVYNQAMLRAANAQPPTDWQQLRNLALQLSVRDEGRLEQAGVALGTAENIDHAADILGLMMLQNGANPGNPITSNAQTALEFYTIFQRLDGSWDRTMAQSTLAFANEDVAMILVPSWRLHEIKNMNPNLQFGVAPLPQLSDDKLTWATYWAEGVNAKSTHKKEAWEFLTWLSQPEQLRQLYSEASKYRSFGELYPRVSMAKEITDPLLAPYLEDALYARSWYLAGSTHDSGLNDKLIAHYIDAINLMNSKGSAETALQSILPGIQQVLSLYGVSVSR